MVEPVRATAEHYAMYVGLEAAATTLRNFDLAVMPGLLQTERYARGLIDAAFPDQPGEAERRMGRGMGQHRPRDLAEEHAQQRFRQLVAGLICFYNERVDILVDSEVQERPGVVARQIDRGALCDSCLQCPVHNVCGAGQYAHRFPAGRRHLLHHGATEILPLAECTHYYYASRILHHGCWCRNGGEIRHQRTRMIRFRRS